MESKPFAYRGFMLDAARHFMPASDVCRIIEAAALCGMNRMHWHLTDDQGWRVEIRRYPRLTKIGSVRGRSFFGAANEEENNTGFYTQDEIRQVVAFAKARGVEIVPEIEVPGHASAMLAAYPQFGCRRVVPGPEGDTVEDAPYDYQVGTIAGVFPNLICAGRDDAVRFLKDILDEITELFPGREIHIGGDEAIKQHWRRCPDCQKRIRDEKLADESELQRWLVLQIGQYLAQKGRKTIVWNESLEGGLLPEHFIVQHWLGNEGMPRRYADYLPTDGFTTLNMVSSVGAFILGLSMLPFLYNVFKSYRYGEVVTKDDPWGFGNSLEWATSCPPPRHNFTELPRIRSERPAFELHYPHLVERLRKEAHTGGKHKKAAVASVQGKADQIEKSGDAEK